MADSSEGSSGAGSGSGRRHDPQRRDRIIEAALQSIAAEGVAGTSHRRVAALADVPLGSMTYHFAGMDDLLQASFTRFTERISSTFEERLAGADDAGSVLEAVVALVHEDLQRSRTERVITYELYTLAARRPEFRSITRAWMRASRRALERHVDPVSARRLDAYVEGAALHVALDPDPQTAAETRAALRLLLDGPSEPGPERAGAERAGA